MQGCAMIIEGWFYLIITKNVMSVSSFAIASAFNLLQVFE
jgi:hypothetical protein